MADLNPQIVELSVGTRELKKITIYPLSMADQFKMTDAIVEVFQEFVGFDNDSIKDEEIVERAISLIEANIEKLLVRVLNEEDKITMADLTNDQFTDICEIIFVVNYEGSVKKFRDLVGRVKALLPQDLQKPPIAEENPS